MRTLSWMATIFILLFPSYSLPATHSQRLAFAANANGNWDLFTVEEDGKNLQRLTNTPYDEKEPSWSSDRKQIIYATSDGKLNIINVDTEDHQQLVIDKLVEARLSPSFSPNNKKIAYTQFISGGKDDTDLKIFDLETKTAKILINQYAAQFWPVWSPDGKRIVYTNAQCSADCGRIIQELWMADPTGGYARQLLMTNSHCQQPAWSPDGGRVAFSSDKSGNFDIWILSLNGWKLEQITKDNNLDVCPTWSPDGNKLAFISTRSGKMEIWIKDLENENFRKLTPFGNKVVECKDVAW